MRVVTLVCAILTVAASAFAQSPPRLELWADAAQSTCQISESPSGLTEVHMFLTGNMSVGGVDFFAVPVPSCWTGATWVGDVLEPGLDAGGSNSQDTIMGMIIGWPGCRDLPVYLGKIVFATTGQALPCCPLEIVAPLDPNGPQSLECSSPQRMWVVGTQGAFINGDDTCPCGPPVPVEDKTWGGIKALYR